MGKKERDYDRRIALLMKKIIDLCKEHEIPMIAAFQLDPAKDGATQMVASYLPFEHQDDRLVDAHRVLLESWKAWPRDRVAVGESLITMAHKLKDETESKG